MRNIDWAAVCVVAVAMALGVIAVELPPASWAADSVPVIPALKATELKIPWLDATIKATAERTPGGKVIVDLTCECDTGNEDETIQVVVQVMRVNPRILVSRVAYIPPPPQKILTGKPQNQISRSATPTFQEEIAKTTCEITIDSDGHGEASVKLPIRWTSADTDTQKKENPLTGCYLVISSPSLKGETEEKEEEQVVYITIP